MSGLGLAQARWIDLRAAITRTRRITTRPTTIDDAGVHTMMGLPARLVQSIGPVGRPIGRRSRPARNRRRLAWEVLESRELLSGLGTDYTLMGGQWDDSKTISYSVAPDGVNWDQGTNAVNSQLNAQFGGSGWQNLVARALQTWAAVTNLNFTKVADGPYDFNSSGVNQGDPDFGDIRIGGYNFGTNATIARTYGPPPNGQTGAGDVELNTSFNFTPGTRYDLQTVLTHELGHSLGLGESPQPSSVMYTYYSGVRQSLSAFDVEGIQSIYGARTADSYQSRGQATSASTAMDLTTILNPMAQGQIAGLSLSTIGDVEYFSIVAPALTGSTFKVAAIAQGFSLMSPKISVIDPSTGATLAVDGHADQFGDIALDSVPGIQAGHRYLIAVTGATNDVFSVGSYGIQLGFFGGTPIVATPPTAPLPPPTPPAPVIRPDPLPYNNTFAQATDLGVDTQPIIGNLTLPSGMNYQTFTIRATHPGLVQVNAVGATILVVDPTGRHIVLGTGVLGFNQAQGGGRYFLILLSTNGAPVANYAFSVKTPVASTSIPTPPPVVPTTIITSTKLAKTTKPHVAVPVKVTTHKTAPKKPARPKQK